MTDYLIFANDADAETALAQLNAKDAMGFANPATQTATWDVIRHRATDGKPVFMKPEDRYLSFIKGRMEDGALTYIIEPIADDWFPPPPDPLTP